MLRHLLLVYDMWFGRAVLGEEWPYHPLGVTASFLDPVTLGLDHELRPSLDDVLAARNSRQDQLRAHLSALDDDALRRTLPRHGLEGWPPDEERSTLDCLLVILDEEWAHHGFAVRDLDVLDPPEAQD